MELKQLDVETMEVSGDAAKAILSGFPDYLSDIAKTFLLMNDMQEPESGTWVSLPKVVNVLNSISNKFGDATLYEIGKATPTNAILVGNIKDLKMALEKICEGFTINHKNTKVCSVEILEYSYPARKALVQITNPYPFEMNRGIIAGLARKYEPANAKKIPEVTYEENSCIRISEFENQCKIKLTW
ncbi:MAG: hypothetical protein WCX31_21980 [Salinivirgaceae bacterium]|jgi:hypothetical protein